MKWVVFISTTLLVGITSEKDPVASFSENVSDVNFRSVNNGFAEQPLPNNHTFFDSSSEDFSLSYLQRHHTNRFSLYHRYCPNDYSDITSYPKNTAYYISSLHVNTVGVICSCSAFNRAVVVTAASCVYRKNVNSLRVVMRFERWHRNVIASMHRVKKYYIAPRFNPVRDINNVAVLVLKPPYPKFALYRFALPIDHFPKKKLWYFYRWLYNMKEAKYIPVYESPDLLPLSYCQRVYHERYEKHHRCIGKGGECFYFNSLDVGSPLVATPKYKNVRILYGIYTGIHVHHLRRVHVYADTVHLSSWIKRLVRANNPYY